jgi:serine O-acetyltransferase
MAEGNDRDVALEWKAAIIAERRERFPAFSEAVLGDAEVFSRYRAERSDFRGPVDGWLRAIRLMWVTDAFFAFACYRLKAAAQAKGIPIVPRLAHKMAMRSAGVCIGDPVVIAPGIYVPHGQIVIDGIVEIAAGTLLFPWTTIGLKAGNPVGPTIEGHVTVATGAKVVGPVHVGAAATVGANAVVVHDVAARTTVVGAPARPVGRQVVDAVGIEPTTQGS